MLKSIKQNEELNNAIGDGRARWLNHKHIGPADTLLDLDQHILIGELIRSRLPQGQTELATYSLSKLRMG